MEHIEKIAISWQSQKGKKRHAIAYLYDLGNKWKLEYDTNEVLEAKKVGFSEIFGFPFKEDGTSYTEGVKEVFSLRIIPKERKDRLSIISFWLCTNEMSDYELLGRTLGRLATDSFEFLPVFKLDSGSFEAVFELSSLSHLNTEASVIPEDYNKLKLRLVRDSSNVHDAQAVKVYLKSNLLGYIRRPQQQIFYDDTIDASATLHYVIKNGTVKVALIKVAFNKK